MTPDELHHNIDVVREEIIHAVLAVATARAWYDMTPGDPHGADQIDYASDRLDEMLSKYVAILPTTPTSKDTHA